jgi:hypothetical protein
MNREQNSKSIFLNRMIIGLAYGLIRNRDSLLTKEYDFTPQDAMDYLSIGIGREMMKELIHKKRVKIDDNDKKLIQKLLKILNIGEQLDLEVYNQKVKMVVRKCLICPKRIGGYDLEGHTACPVGGIVIGAISHIRDTYPRITKNKLNAGEICHIEVNYQID